MSALENRLATGRVYGFLQVSDMYTAVVLSPPLPVPPPAGSDTFPLARVNQYAGLHFTQENVSALGITIVPTYLLVKCN